MKKMVMASAAAGLFCVGLASAQMPSWSDAQAEVWSYVEQSWVDDATETGAWPGEYVHEQGVTWGDDHFAPRGKADWVKWSEYADAHGDTELYHLTPMAISVVGTTAVAHYHAEFTVVDTDGERDQVSLGIVETLVREDGNWIYLSSVAMTFGD